MSTAYELVTVAAIYNVPAEELSKVLAVPGEYPGLKWADDLTSDTFTVFGPKEIIATLKYDLEKREFAVWDFTDGDLDG